MMEKKMETITQKSREPRPSGGALRPGVFAGGLAVRFHAAPWLRILFRA